MIYSLVMIKVGGAGSKWVLESHYIWSKTMTHMHTYGKISSIFSFTTTRMKEEASNPIQVIIDLTVEWRLPIGVSSYYFLKRHK